MLAHMHYYCKIMVFSPFKLNIRYYHSFQDDETPKMHCTQIPIIT